MAGIKFYNVVAKDGQTAKQRYDAITQKEEGAFYKVGEECYLKDQLITTDKAEEISVLDTAGNFDGTNVESVLAELAGMVGDQEVTVVKSTGSASDNYATRYEFYQGGVAIANGTIDILKDMVATSGTIVYPSPEHPIIIGGQTITEGVYIELTIANGDPFYINVADLIEYNTFVDTDEFTFQDSSHQITITVAKIAGSKIIYRFADPTADPPVTELTINAKVDQVEGRVADLETYVGTIPQTSSATDVIGYVDEKTQGGVSSLNGKAGVASKSYDNVVTIKGGVIEVEGIIQNAPNADKASTEDVYWDAAGSGKIYSDLAMTVEVTPVTTKTYIDLISGKHLNWVGNRFVEPVPDVVLEKVAVTGAAEDVSIADAGSFITATTVEGAIQELATNLTWQEI